MELREDVITCLEERLLNRTKSGRVFDSEQEYLRWLKGNDGSSGFIGDPAMALREAVPAMREAGHPGVDLSEAEAETIRRLVSKTDLRGLASRVTSMSTAAAMMAASVVFLGPILADTGGY